MEKIPDEIKIKIIEKMRGMIFVRSMEEQNPRITIPEFKFIICSFKIKGNPVFRIKKGNWFALAKELEKDGIIKLHCHNPIEVLRSNVKG